jgi:hypothetical protein
MKLHQLQALVAAVEHGSIRAAARELEGELADLRQRLNEHRNALNAAEGRIAFNEERKHELESRIRRFMDDHIVPFITGQKFCNAACDRLMANIGAHGGQEVPHLHVHIFGGQPLGPMIMRR